MAANIVSTIKCSIYVYFYFLVSKILFYSVPARMSVRHGIFTRLFCRFLPTFWLRILPDKNRLCYRSSDWEVIELLIREIYSQEVYDHFEVKFGFKIIDAGAHIGVYALKASKRVGEEGLVIALEPDPNNFRMLCKNIKINECKNVIPLNSALGSYNGKIKLYLCPWSGGHSTVQKHGKDDRWVMVQVRTLESLCREFHMKNVDLVKIDVEGAESEVVKGAKNISIKRYVIEVSHFAEEAQELEDLLSSRGYEVLVKSVPKYGDYVYATKHGESV